MKHRPSRCSGFAIVSAIFILVVLAALGAFMISISSQQHIGSALDVQGARAYQAARAGIEWGLHRQLRSGSCLPSTNFSPPATSMAGFTVNVSCVATPDGSGGPTVFVITSTACNDATCPNTTNPGNLYIERRLTVTF